MRIITSYSFSHVIWFMSGDFVCSGKPTSFHINDSGDKTYTVNGVRVPESKCFASEKKLNQSKK